MALPKRPSLKDPKLKCSMLRDWTPDEVAEWLEEVNNGLFAKYVEHVFTHQIGGADLMNLTTNDMTTKLCMTIPNHMVTLSASIDRLKNGRHRRKHSPVPRASGSLKYNLDDLLDIRIPSQQDTSNHILKTHSAPTPTLNAPGVHHSKSVFMPLSTNKNTNKNTKGLKLKHEHNKMKRSRTVVNGKKKKKAYNKPRQNTIALKRELTQQNLSSKKQDFHKDLGKKLWPNEMSKIIKEGWIKKRGVRRSGFKERWCVLRDNGHFYYFAKRPSGQLQTKKNDLPQGMLDLNHVSKIEYVQDDDPNTFNVKTNDRDWIFSTMSGGELVQWMSALNKTLVSLRN